MANWLKRTFSGKSKKDCEDTISLSCMDNNITVYISNDNVNWNHARVASIELDRHTAIRIRDLLNKFLD